MCAIYFYSNSVVSFLTTWPWHPFKLYRQPWQHRPSSLCNKFHSSNLKSHQAHLHVLRLAFSTCPCRSRQPTPGQLRLPHLNTHYRLSFKAWLPTLPNRNPKTQDLNHRQLQHPSNQAFWVHQAPAVLTSVLHHLHLPRQPNLSRP